jgi:hypothetical protein
MLGLWFQNKISLTMKWFWRVWSGGKMVGGGVYRLCPKIHAYMYMYREEVFVV